MTATADRATMSTAGWAGPAADYDRWFDKPWGRYAFAVESAAIAHAAHPVTGQRVLDAGCGTGRFGSVLANIAPVAGVDPDRGMLALACPRLAGRCAQGVVEHLPFPDGAFDLTVAVTVLEFVTDPAVAVAELARVTRRGGRIIIGALNPRGPWGLANRRRLRAGVWCDARFLDRATLQALGAPHGRTTIRGALYAPSAFPGLTLIGPALETLGRITPGWGAFQVLTVDRPANQ